MKLFKLALHRHQPLCFRTYTYTRCDRHLFVGSRVIFACDFPSPFLFFLLYLYRMCVSCLSYSVCVLHVKPLFLLVDIQQSQCPWRFFNPRRDTSSVVPSTNLRHRDTTLPRMQDSFNTAYQSKRKSKFMFENLGESAEEIIKNREK